jgi:hypothetical protein
MSNTAQQIKDKRLINLAYVLVFIYNIIFFSSRFSQQLGIPSWHVAFEQIDDSYFLFTILEFFGVASIFVEFLSNYDTKSFAKRRLQLILCGLFAMAFIFKVFVVYMDSSVG